MQECWLAISVFALFDQEVFVLQLKFDPLLCWKRACDMSGMKDRDSLLSLPKRLSLSRFWELDTPLTEIFQYFQTHCNETTLFEQLKAAPPQRQV